jgi:transcriptional regulator with XRE-family HTH domain
MEQPYLGKKILELRIAKGLTQVELAEKCNLNLRTIQRIESAEVTPRSHTVKLIFSNLDCDIYNSQKFQSPEERKVSKGNSKEITHVFKYIIELFNLKTNTMKKLTFLSLIFALISFGLFLNKSEAKSQTIDGWFKAGNKPKSYTIGIDKSTFKTGNSSAFIESIDKKIEGFGTIMQTCSAHEYLGKRIKMTAFIKSENVTGWSGMWLRVDSKETKKALSFDNMQERPIKGNTEWKQYEIILDVPEESGTLNFGILLSGTGKVWFDNISFEVVDKLQVQTTKNQPVILDKPTNIDFEK